MMSMRILHIDTNHPILREQLAAAGFENVADYHCTYTELIDQINQFDGLILRSRLPIDKNLLEKTTRLQFIGRVGAGLENIDIETAKKQGIQVFAVPEGNENAVGEHALGMLLSLLNRLEIAHREMQAGIWKRAENRGFELEGKTIGIIGYGRMGNSFAKKLNGFNCKVLAVDIIPALGNQWAQQVPLEVLQNEADIISLHVPQTPETYHLIDAAFIAACKKPFWIVNTARGAVVDTKALIDGLDSGGVLGACLDVHEFESKSFENLTQHPLLTRLIADERVLMTPHIAGWTHESHFKMANILAEKIIDWKQKSTQ
ncbi:MAG: hydroxyacid dehydrogenase [Flavobacterium sp. BFFFF2]|nr:MAG: hydroxyacid dehydrogenase [Flavobacterium sp. BFFFF2]